MKKLLLVPLLIIFVLFGCQAALQYLETDTGQVVQNWKTDTDVEDGGSDSHQFNFAEKTTVDVPAGSFEAYHIVHNRTVDEADHFAYDEYFVPENWYVQFEYPEESIWKLK